MRHSSFTLVELLVVLAIIIILAAVLVSAASVVIRAAKRAKATNTANQIQTACLAYYTEYSVYPVPGGTTTDWTNSDTSAGATAWGTLICVLSGNIQPYNPGTAFTTSGATITNSRGVAFLALKSSDVDVNNAPLNPLPTGTEIYFNIAMDSDYNGVMGATVGTTVSAANLPNFAAASTANTPSGVATALAAGGTSTAGIAVWANCNGTTGTTNANFFVHTY